jgi:hypothetical protein
MDAPGQKSSIEPTKLSRQIEEREIAAPSAGTSVAGRPINEMAPFPEIQCFNRGKLFALLDLDALSMNSVMGRRSRRPRFETDPTESSFSENAVFLPAADFFGDL